MTIVNIQISDLENRYVFYRHTKNRKKQTVPIIPTMVGILREYLNYLLEDTTYLFPTVLGEQLKVRSLTHTLEDYSKSREVSRTGIHKFRHWFAFLIIQNLLQRSSLTCLLILKVVQYLYN